MFKQKKKGQMGFTLIELLAVVAILGILAGVAVPRVMGALANARPQANIANVAILQSAVERWGMENNAESTLAGWADMITGTPAITVPPALPSNFVISPLPAGLVPNFIASIPTPPVGGTYRIQFDGTTARATATVVRVP
ncbi:MAG: Type II secretion system protein G [Firmicutes bacterium]|nr:Type II secretion system protein G [Bacillota bacterium]